MDKKMRDMIDSLSCYGLDTVIVEGGVPNTVFVADLKTVTMNDGRHSFACKQPQIDRFVNVDNDQARLWKRDVRDCYLGNPADAKTLCEGKAMVEIVSYYDNTIKQYIAVDEPLNKEHDIIGLFKAKMIVYECISHKEIAEFLVQNYHKYYNYRIEVRDMSDRGCMFALYRCNEPTKVFAKQVAKIHQVDDCLSDQDHAKLVVKANVSAFVTSEYNVHLDASDLEKVTKFQFENWDHPWSTNRYLEMRIAETCGLVDIHSVCGIDYAMVYPDHLGLIASKCTQEEIQDILDYASKMNEEANQKLAAKIRKGKVSIDMVR